MTTNTEPTVEPDGTVDCHDLIAELLDLNRQLLAGFKEQREVYETMLAAFAADGYRPAATALLGCRRAKHRADMHLRDLRAARKNA